MTTVDAARRTTCRAEAERIGAEVAGPAAAEVDRRRALSGRGDRGVARGALSLGTDPRRARRTRRERRRGRRRRVRARPALRVDRHGLRHAPDPGGLPGASRPARLLPRLPGRLVERQFLLASATTEVGVGGDVGPACAPSSVDERYHPPGEAGPGHLLRRNTPTACWPRPGASPDSPPNDQVLVLCRPPGLALEQIGGWDTLGFRGTCSLGYRLVARARRTSSSTTPTATSRAGPCCRCRTSCGAQSGWASPPRRSTGPGSSSGPRPGRSRA